jgi:hypothetical protein
MKNIIGRQLSVQTKIVTVPRSFSAHAYFVEHQSRIAIKIKYQLPKTGFRSNFIKPSYDLR